MRNGNWREVPRKELVRTLNNSIAAHYLTVVAAPAGYGKTSIARKLTGQKKRRRFFYSIPEKITSPAQWWDSLFESLADQGLEHASAIRRIGLPLNASTTRRAIELIESVSVPFVLILDDFHNFTDPDVDMFLEALVRAKPSDHRFVLLSRVKPRMELDDLAEAKLAAVYSRSFLKFTEADAVRFFFLNGVPDRHAAKQAWLYSEGWIAALWLCLLHRKDDGEAPPSKDIDTLLEDAVFARYSTEERDFLMMLSVLGSFTSNEAESLTLRADAASRLRHMSNGNVFISHDDSAGKYVLHSIFRDFLGKKLAASEDVNAPELYRRAAECHIWRGDSLPAFQLLVKAGRDDDLSRILEVILADGRQSIFKAKREEFLPIIEAIPWRLRLKQPLGYVLFIWLCFDDDIDDPLAVALFEEMARRFTSAKGIPSHLKHRLAGEMEFMRAWIYTNAEPELVAPRYEKACGLLDGPSIIRYELRCWNFGAPHMLFVYLPKGVSYPDAFGVMAPACRPMSVLTGGVIEGCDSICDAEYHLERGEFERAANVVGDLEQTLDFPRNMTSFVIARFLRARLTSFRGDAEKAVAILTDLLRDVEATDSSEHIQCAELALGYVLAVSGRPDAAPRWLRDCDIFDRPYGATRILGFMTTVCGKLLLAKDDLDGLAAFLTTKSDVFGSAGYTFGGIHAAVFEAILAWRRGDADAALGRMREAVDLSRPDGLVLPLAEYGGHVLPMLVHLKKEMRDDGRLERILEIAEQVETNRRRRKNREKRDLTAHERDIMRLVVMGKSTPAIVEKIGSTQSAVKNSIMSAYKKLGAKNRADAARLFSHSTGTRSRIKMVESADPDIHQEMRNAKHVLSARRSADDGYGNLMRLAGENVASGPSNKKRRHSAAGGRALGELLARRGDSPDAFHSLLRTGGDGERTRALELFQLPASAKMIACRFKEVCAAVELIPWPVRLMRPMEYLTFLWRRFRVFDRVTSGMELDEAEYRLSRAAPEARESKSDLAGEIALLRSLLHAHDAKRLWDGHDAAYRLLDGRSRLYTSDVSWTFGNPHFSFTVVREPGGFDALAKRAAAASDTLAALSGGAFTSLDPAFRMERHLERGEANEAAAILDELESRTDDMQALILAAFSRARLSLAAGMPDAAVEQLEILAARVRRLDFFELSESIDLALGYVHAHLGRIDGVPRWLRTGILGSPPHGAAARCPFASVVYAKTLLAARDFARLGAAARAMPTRFGRHDSLLGRIHAKVLEAIAEKYFRREDEALARLGEAVELSRPDGIVFSIAEYRARILPLLRRLHRANPDDGHIKRLALFAKQNFRQPAHDKENGQNSHFLTLREREIMSRVIRGESNQVVARKLGVSSARINKALIGIYKKLNVSNRTEAARRFAMECDGE